MREGDTFRFPELAEELERFGAEGVEPFYRGEVAALIAEFVAAAGGAIGAGDLAAYEAIEREPIRAGLPRDRGPDQPAALLGRAS